jgi:HTH-type transcriptional regulator / antitoxin HipB
MALGRGGGRGRAGRKAPSGNISLAKRGKGRYVPERELVGWLFGRAGYYYRSGTMSIRTTEQLGTAIRSRRKRLKLTQKELAMAVGTGLRFIIDLERGKATCQVGKTLAVLQSLGLAVETRPLGGDGRGGEPA